MFYSGSDHMRLLMPLFPFEKLGKEDRGGAVLDVSIQSFVELAVQRC